MDKLSPQSKRDTNLIYKYTPHDKCYKYDIIAKQELWFAKIDSLNDPLDSNLAYRQEYSADEISKCLSNSNSNTTQDIEKYCNNSKLFVEHQNELFKLLRAKIGILCMTTNPKNILMWAHYANGHKGIVYEFDKKLFKYSESKDSKHKLVKYPPNRQYNLLSYTLPDRERIEQFLKSLIIKAKDWNYEKEVRFFDFSKSGFARKFDPDCLKSIIFGIRTPDYEISTIMDCCKKHNLNHITFKQAEFIPGKFEIKLKKLDKKGVKK